MEIRKAIEDNYPVLAPVETGTNIVYTISDKEAKGLRTMPLTRRLKQSETGLTSSELQSLRFTGREQTDSCPASRNKGSKRAIEIIGKTAQLEFKIVDDASPVAAEIPATVAPGEEDAVLKKFAEKIPSDDEGYSLRKRLTGKQAL